VLASLEAPVYIERVALGNNKMIVRAGRAIKKAIENQILGRGFSFTEILSPCPTIWKMSAVDAQKWVRDVMEKTYPLGVLCDRSAERQPRTAPDPAPALARVPGILGITSESASPLPISCGRDSITVPGWSHEKNGKLRSLLHSAPSDASGGSVDLRIRVAGFGGQGVLLAGEVLAEAGLDAGLEVSWLPSYGPEMRSGTSNCHIRLSNEPIDSPLVTSPNMLLAMNEPSLKKFAASVQPGGWILYNGESIPEDCKREGVHALAFPFTQIADRLGESRVANMVILGALLEITGALPEACVNAALHRLVKHSKWLEIDELAVARGRELYREWKEMP